MSIIVPAYNEEKVIVQTIASLLNQKYAGPIEIVVVDDGSSDDTIDIVREAYGSHPSVSAYRKENGGKASALNYGIAHAQHEIVIGLDADTIFDDDTVAELVQPLKNPSVGAVAGNAKVGNRINLVTRWQALEYVTSQNLDRRAFSLLDCITVVPGAVGAWRRSVVQEVGGFREDTLAEDQDLTLAIRRVGPLGRVRRRRRGVHRGAGHAARPGEAALPLVVRHAAVHVEAPRRLLPTALRIAGLRRTSQRLPVPAAAPGHLAGGGPHVPLEHRVGVVQRAGAHGGRAAGVRLA